MISLVFYLKSLLHRRGPKSWRKMPFEHQEEPKGSQSKRGFYAHSLLATRSIPHQQTMPCIYREDLCSASLQIQQYKGASILQSMQDTNFELLFHQSLSESPGHDSQHASRRTKHVSVRPMFFDSPTCPVRASDWRPRSCLFGLNNAPATFQGMTNEIFETTPTSSEWYI